jgi:hypothetical protein
MEFIKITTEEKSLVKNYMNDVMSFDNGLIEIIVGWDLAKQRGAKILDHHIDDKTYWTFSPREKRKIFEEQMVSLTNEIFTKLIKNVKINNLDPLNFSGSNEYLFFLKNNIQDCVGYLYSDRLYVYCGTVIHHIDTSLLHFLNWDILDDIKNLITIEDNIEIPETLKDFDIKYIPYLNAKKGHIVGNVHG